jgi:hypothetical protein
MSIKSLYPDTRPSLNLDFANTKVLDPRITFARASTATYYDGKTVSKAEENLILLSQQFINWNTLDSTLTADTDTAPDGTQTADKIVPNTTNIRHIAYLGVGSITNNLPYTYSAYFKAAGYNFAQLGLYLNSGGCDAYIIIDLTNGSVTQSAGNTGVRGSFTFSVQSVGNGWYRGVITCGNVTGMSTAQGMILAPSDSGTPSIAAAGSPTFSGNGTSGVLIWGAQMEQRSGVTAYTPTTAQPITRYQPTLLTAPIGTARFDHNPTTGESLGLLIEEQRTNMALYSEDFNNANWLKNGAGNPGTTITFNQTIAPDGTLTADYVDYSTATAQSQNVEVQYDGTPAGKTYTGSVWIKGISGQTINLTMDANGVSGTAVQYTLNGEWQRFSATRTYPTGSPVAFFRFGIRSLNHPSTGTATKIFAWGAQIELGAFATSYIPTVASQVTRSADYASMTGTNFSSWFNPSEGTFVAECDRGNDGTEGAGIGVARAAADSYFDMIQFGEFYDNGGNVGRIYKGGIAEAAPGATHTTGQGIFNRYSFAYKTNDVGGAINGVMQGTDSDAMLPTNLDRFLFGGYDDSRVESSLDGRIKYLRYYPKRLSNTQLQSLTRP